MCKDNSPSAADTRRQALTDKLGWCQHSLATLVSPPHPPLDGCFPQKIKSFLLLPFKLISDSLRYALNTPSMAPCQQSLDPSLKKRMTIFITLFGQASCRYLSKKYKETSSFVFPAASLSGTLLMFHLQNTHKYISAFFFFPPDEHSIQEGKA